MTRYMAQFMGVDGLISTMQEKLFKEQNTCQYNHMSFVTASHE